MSDTYVLLHGFTGGPASFDPLIAELPSESRVIRPLLAGHGARPAHVESWTHEVARLCALLEAEDVEGAHLVGYSMGGRVARALFAAARSRFSRATLVGARPGLTTDIERQARRDADRRWTELLRSQGLGVFLDGWEALPLWASQAALPPEALAEQRRVRSEHTAEGLAHALDVLGLAEMPPIRPMPATQLVAGALDPGFVRIAGESDVTLIPGAGHNVLLERPRELAALLVGTAG